MTELPSQYEDAEAKARRRVLNMIRDMTRDQLDRHTRTLIRLNTGQITWRECERWINAETVGAVFGVNA